MSEAKYATGGVVPRDRAVVIGEYVPPLVFRKSLLRDAEIRVDFTAAYEALPFGRLPMVQQIGGTPLDRFALRPSRFPRRPIERREAT